MTMHDSLDPRLWNLFAGAVMLAAGCGGRGATSDGSETGTSGDEPTECVSNVGCPDQYWCVSGVCVYYEPDDGNMPYEPPPGCYVASDCAADEACELGDCIWVGLPPPACSDTVTLIPLPDVGPVLRMTFADVDADGQDELVAATQTALNVYESGSTPFA